MFSVIVVNIVKLLIILLNIKPFAQINVFKKSLATPHLRQLFSGYQTTWCYVSITFTKKRFENSVSIFEKSYLHLEFSALATDYLRVSDELL